MTEAKIDHRGYVRLPAPGRDGFVYEHRAVMEDLLGRPLGTWEHVHHRNGNKSDNRPENLEVMPGSAHVAHHNRCEPKRRSGRSQRTARMTRNERLRAYWQAKYPPFATIGDTGCK